MAWKAQCLQSVKIKIDARASQSCLASKVGIGANSEREIKTSKGTFTSFIRIYAERVGQDVKHFQSAGKNCLRKQIQNLKAVIL